MKLIGLLQGGGVSLALLGQDVEDDGLVLRLESLKGVDERRDVVSIDGAVIAQAEIFKDDTGSEEVFDAGLDLVGEIAGLLSSEPFHEIAGLLVKVGKG